MTSNGDLFVWGRNTEGMFDSEAGIFALDQSLEKPTLLKGIKVSKVSLGPKALLLQRMNTESSSIQGSLLPPELEPETRGDQSRADTEDDTEVKKAGPKSYETLQHVTSFFNEKIVKDFHCGRGMIVVVAEDKPLKEEPVEMLNFLPEVSSEESLELEESVSTIPEVVQELSPEPVIEE